MSEGVGFYMMGTALLHVALVMPTPVMPAAEPDQYSRGVDWLSRYGYLPPPDPRTEKLQTKEGIEKAIRQMQRFGGLKETGKLDSNTLKLMSTPRCSLPDIVGTEDRLRKRRRKKRYALSGLRWEKATLSWSLQSYPKLHSQLQPELVKTIMFNALKVWSDNTNLQFHSSHDKNQADIRISFAHSFHDDGYPFDGKGGTLAHAFFPGQVEIAGDTHFDDEETWTFRASDDAGTDLFTVAVHEFGHALGLSHSSSDPSIMQPYYKGATYYTVGDFVNYVLPMDDRLAIQSIYGEKKETPPPGGRPTPRLPELPKTPLPRPTSQPNPTYQERCNGGFDAVANIRGDVFFFKGINFWRMQRTGSLVSLAPALIRNFWMGLPPDIEKIDAVYERKTDSRIVFFIGSKFWLFEDTKALHGYPHSLSEWGMRTHEGRPVNKVEAAFVWAHNGKTYLFSGGEFWRFAEVQGDSKQLDADYPRNASLWRGVPSNPDDIMNWKGDTYFFKDNSYWVLKSGGLDQDVISPKSTAVDWMLCPAPKPTIRSPGNPRSGDSGCSCDINRASRTTTPSLLCLMPIFFYCFNMLMACASKMIVFNI